MTAPGLRVLFLDVDGVILAGRHWRAGWKRSAETLPTDTTALLDAVCQRAGCRVVLSSTWRRDAKCRQHLRDAGFVGRFHRDWRTPLDGECRGTEIADWLARHPEVTTYAIIDDDSDMLPEQLPRFVKTAFEDGIRQEHVEQLVAILAEPPGSRS